MHPELLGGDPFAQLEARRGDARHLYVVAAGDPAARDWPLRWVAHGLAEGTMVRSVLSSTADGLVGDLATRDALLARWSGSPVLHFAGHGALTEGRPWEARLRLAGGETVTVADILMLRPSLGLVVLSGCDTGRAEALSSLEDVGLSEAFLAAGARTVVATVSPVDDAQAAAFVSGFYANGGALAPAEAWRHLMKSDDPELRAAAASWRVFGRP